jgi:hypothetical protein
MPANVRRKLVVSRMLPETIKKLDAICVDATNKRGRPVYRSEMLNDLVEEKHRDIKSRGTRRAALAAR